VVQGVALELLCRLLFTEGSNPSLSVSFTQFTDVIDRNISNQIPMDATIPTPTVRPFVDMDSRVLIQISVIWKILESNGQGMKIPLVSLVRFKSDENNIRQLAIHLFSNRPIYYLLFD
jgi:hypothetical protein